MQPIQLIDSRPRFDPRAVFAVLVLAGATAFTAFVLGRSMDIQGQVLTLVILDVLLLTTFVAFYDVTNSIILWFFALTLITRYTQLNMPGIPDMSGPRFMLVLMWAVFLVDVVLRRRRPLPATGIELLMLFFVGTHLASMILHENLVQSATRISPITPFFNFVVFPIAAYYLVRNCCTNDRATRKLLIAFAVLQVFLVINGVLEHYRVKGLVLPPDVLDPKAGDGRWFGVRIRGPFLHSPVYGATMGMGFFLLLHLYNYTRGKWRWPMLVGLLVTPLACFYTLTRQVWLGLALPMLLGAFFSKRQRLVLVVLAFAALAFLSLVDWSKIIDPEVAERRATDESTGEARIAVLVVAFHMFADQPIFGQGLGMWTEKYESYRLKLTTVHWMFGDIPLDMARETYAHNTFSRLGVELGLLGLVPYVLIFFLVFRASLDLYRRSGPRGLYGRELVVAFWQLAIAYLTCINFVDPSFHEFLPGFFFTWAAVIVRRAELARGAPPQVHEAGLTSFGEAV